MKQPVVGDLKIHIGSCGRLFYHHSNQQLEAVEDIREFISLPWVREADPIRLLGSIRHAPLIAELYAVENLAGRIKLASPFQVHHAGEPEHPEAIFACLDNLAIPPSLGGWHRMTRCDWVSYAMIAELLNHPGEDLTPRAISLLRQHPAWLAVSFLCGNSLPDCAHFLATMTDPRWHASVGMPDRDSRLKSYFGLGANGEKHVARVLDNWEVMDFDLLGETKLDRLALALQLWTQGRRTRSPGELKLPGNFLWRIAKSSPLPKRLLRASHAMLKFVRSVWLDSLTPPRLYRPDRNGVQRLQPTSDYRRTLFVPEHFFVETETLEAWLHHVSKGPDHHNS